MGAVLIATKEGKPVLVMPQEEVLPGVRVCEVSDTIVTYHPKE